MKIERETKDKIETKFGWIPNDWIILKYKEILIEGKLGGNYENSESNTGLPVIKMGNIGRGIIETEKLQYLPKGFKYNDDDVLKRGDLLFNTRNTLDLVGKVAIWNNELPKAIYNSNLMRMRFKTLYVESNKFMNYVFNSQYGLRQLRGVATGTTSVAAIYGRDLDAIKFFLPPLFEQRKIADILSTWDDAICTTQESISELKKRNKGLAQQLLNGRKRLKGFYKDWCPYKIGQIAKPINWINKENIEFEVLSCTKYDGLVPSLEYFGRQVFGENLSKYKIVPKGAFAYATNHIEEGSIGYQNSMDMGLVSPMYTVFETNKEVSDEFLFRLLKSDRMIYSYQSNMSGSINRRGGLRWNDFSKIKTMLPELKEQIAIANLLNEADQELLLMKQQAETLHQEKKGLMQKLLTGEVRV